MRREARNRTRKNPSSESNTYEMAQRGCKTRRRNRIVMFSKWEGIFEWLLTRRPKFNLLGLVWIVLCSSLRVRYDGGATNVAVRDRSALKALRKERPILSFIPQCPCLSFRRALPTLRQLAIFRQSLLSESSECLSSLSFRRAMRTLQRKIADCFAMYAPLVDAAIITYSL